MTMKPTDLYYETPTKTIFYSSIHAFNTTKVYINNAWWESDEVTIKELKEGKLKYEQLKLVVSPEEINTMLEKAITKSSLQSTIDQALDTSISELKANMANIVESVNRILPQVERTKQEMSAAIASTTTYKKAIETTTEAINLTKENLPSMEEVKASLKEAKSEFTQVTNKLKELFK